MRQIGSVPEKWLTHPKESGNDFVKMLGIKTPETVHHIKFKDINPKSNIVIKPSSGRGSRDVYLVNEPDHIISLSNGSILNGWEKLKEAIKKELDSGIISQDDFIVQECIYGDEMNNPGANYHPVRTLVPTIPVYCSRYSGKVP